MAGTLVIDTLKASSGVLATQNGMSGIAKAWINFNASTSTIKGSFNVTSLTKNTTGDWSINFTTAMPNVNYAMTGSTNRYGSSGLAAMLVGAYDTTNASTAYCRITIGWEPSGALYDCENTSVVIHA